MKPVIKLGSCTQEDVLSLYDGLLDLKECLYSSQLVTTSKWTIRRDNTKSIKKIPQSMV